MKLNLRKDVKNNSAYYEAIMDDGAKYSVVDFGKVMGTAPKILQNNTFMGWEALPIKSDGNLKVDNGIRAQSKEELVEKLKQLHPDIPALAKIFGKKHTPVLVETEGTFYNLRADGHGTIPHCFLVKNGRATRYDSYYSKESKPIPLNNAATIEEVEHLISVLNKLVSIMKQP